MGFLRPGQRTIPRPPANTNLDHTVHPLPSTRGQIAIRSDHPSTSSSRAYHLAHPTSASSSRSITGGLNSLPATLFSTLGNWTTSSRVVNSVRNSVGNIKAHYDISNRMFASFLSADVSGRAAARASEAGGNARASLLIFGWLSL